MFKKILGRLWDNKNTARKTPVKRHTILHLELLEDRWAPATLRVGALPSEYHTIQAAVNAAHGGDHVLVDAGTYQEQVTINKSVDLRVNKGVATILAPTNMPAATAANPGAIVHFTGAGVKGQIIGFVVRGASAGNQNLYYGVRVDGGASARIDSNTITNIIDSINPVLGVAVSIGNGAGSADGLGASVGSAEINFNKITNYQRAGVVVTNYGSFAHVGHNTVTGAATNPAPSITGVEVSVGAYGTVEFNTISSNTNDSNGCGVLLFAPDPQRTAIVHNTIKTSDYGLFGNQVISNSTQVKGNQVNIEFNTITLNSFVGIELDNSLRVDIGFNTISHNGSLNSGDGGIFFFNTSDSLILGNASVNNTQGSGLYLDADSTGNLIQNNSFCGNYSNAALGFADVVDLTLGGFGTNGTDNFYRNNRFGSTIGLTLI